jgi:hypothetical protein
VRHTLKVLACGLALVCIFPSWLSYQVRSRLVGADRALHASSQAWSLVPGLAGQYLRRAFLWAVLDRCAWSVTVEFGTIFSKVDSRLEDNVYIGPYCLIGSAHLERDVLLAAGVHVPSGPETHGSADSSRSIRDQPGRLRTVRIGAGSWVGSAAVVMADVGRHSIVAAGAVVTSPVPDFVVAGGVPARVLKERGAQA